MDASTFQFSLSVPRDPSFVPIVRLVAVQAALYASCGQGAAETFGGSVEKAVRVCLEETSRGQTISVVVRREAGPVEVQVDGRTVTVEP